MTASSPPPHPPRAHTLVVGKTMKESRCRFRQLCDCLPPEYLVYRFFLPFSSQRRTEGSQFSNSCTTSHNSDKSISVARGCAGGGGGVDEHACDTPGGEKTSQCASQRPLDSERLSRHDGLARHYANLEKRHRPPAVRAFNGDIGELVSLNFNVSTRVCI